MNDHFHRSAIRRRKANSGKKIVWMVIVLLIALGGYFWYQNERYQYLLNTPVDATDVSKSTFIIKDGDNIPAIGSKLLEKKLILDDTALTRYLKENNLDRKIVAGRFLLSPSQTIPQITAAITDSKQSEAVVTIPEGTTVKGIDEKLAGLDLIQPGEFIKAVKDFSAFDKYAFLDQDSLSKLAYPLEGYLFPDTYFVDPTTFNCPDLIQLMLKNFDKKTAEIAAQNISIFGEKHSFYELITMSSIVEKEVMTSKDLPIVAGILWKRLDSNWQLGADATLLYLNQEDREISYQDLQEDNPYNTRKHLGLPPGPICNPGLAAIKAALQPEESPYFYYLTKPSSGEVVYAKTNDEHNQNKYKYLNN